MTEETTIEGAKYKVALTVPATTPLRTAYLAAVSELLAARERDEGESAAEETAEAARVALHDSSEDECWIARDGDSGVTLDLGVTTPSDAREDAIAWAEGGDYGDVVRTIWLDVDLRSETGHEDRVTTQIDPTEPACGDGREHGWQSPHAIVGGLRENPGVRGHGGGVICTEVCLRCGCARITDTWAQRRDTGEQGLTSVEYREGTADETGAQRAARDPGRVER